ncbi:hypothetical protein P886_1887 [Alteromonadaceae bacterium 2753L.S.0a.02]|nr:hypothetical protein P886_1887 [Alteromonadaceae bacterium 2753L.S.0a.02]
MSVIAVWKCDRDGSMFEDKKAAEAHDKMLELAANLTQLIESHTQGISEENLEAIGLLLAQRSEALVKACKGKPEALLEDDKAPSKQPPKEPAKLTALAG